MLTEDADVQTDNAVRTDADVLADARTGFYGKAQGGIGTCRQLRKLEVY